VTLPRPSDDLVLHASIRRIFPLRDRHDLAGFEPLFERARSGEAEVV
jgi:hypothetical protein